MKKAQKLTVLICMALICAFVEIPLLAQTPTLHAPNELNDTSDYWGAGSVPNVYRFKTDSVVVVNYHSTPDEGYDWSANVFPALALHGSGSPFHSALLLGNNGKIQLRRTFNSSIGLELSTYWTNETGNLNDQGGYISFRPRSVEKDSTGDYRPGPEAMRIVPGGLIGIGTTSPTEQFHTTKGVRFEGITSNESLSSFLVRDDAGKLFYRDIDFNQFLTFSCTSPSVVPLFDDNGTANLVCSIIKQGKTEGCNGWAHQSVGINGDPVGVGYSGSFGECHNVYLTVHGSALAAGGLWIASDKRIKKDFESVSPELGVEKLRKLNPVRFTYDAQAAQSMGVNGITDHLTENENKIALKHTIESWNFRNSLSEKIGNANYTLQVYDNLMRCVFPFGDEMLLVITLDNSGKPDNIIQRIQRILSGEIKK